MEEVSEVEDRTYYEEVEESTDEEESEEEDPAEMEEYFQSKNEKMIWSSIPPCDGRRMVTSVYTCKRMTARWPLVVFFNILDVSAYNSFVLWSEINPAWNQGKCNKRRLFMEELGRQLVIPHIQRRKTPEGIFLKLPLVSLISGNHSGHYQLAEIVSTGLWKIRAKFDSNPQQSFSAEFEVKEYVLPSFEVKLNPTSSFFYVDDPELTVDIKAKYLFGQEVNGVAYVVFGVINDGHKKSFPSSLQRVQIEEGVGAVTLNKEHITTTFPNIEDLVTKSIYVAVSVLTENGGEMVEAELRNIQIVKSPYTIHFTKTQKYFKPGMSFDVAVNLGDQVNLLEQRVGANEDNVHECVARVKQLEKDNSFLMSKVDDLENRSRRFNLRFVGIQESAEGKGTPLAMSRPRAIMIELLNFQDKVKILRLASEKKSLEYNGKHISIYFDFSPELTRRRRNFDPVKRKLRELNMKYFLLYPCTLCVVVDGTQQRFSTHKDAEAVEVVNPNNTLAPGVAVVVEPGRVTGMTANNGMARLTINTGGNPQQLTITAKTNDPRILLTRQASATMTALPYNTQSNSYIHIDVDSAEVQLRNNLKIRLNLKRQESHDTDITYLIMSRGQLVQKGRHKTRGELLISLMVPITKDMLPSFRIIAYYHTNGNEVVSDSVWVDVKDSCMGSLKLEPLKSALSYEPGKMFSLKVTGDPGAIVGLVAVDKGVYVLNNKHRLTQKKVWDIVETYDTGCTPGGGKDSMSVFYDAGLLFESNTASGTAYRQELKCPAPSRRKRATTFMDVRTSLLSNYTEKLQRDCCLDGMRDTLLSYTCERRVEYIIDGEACAAAFLHCCKDIENQRADSKVESLQLARSEEDDYSYADSNEINSRTKFPESWLCDTTSMTKSVPLQDSITTWQFTGISLSTTHGICVGCHTLLSGESSWKFKAILHNYCDNYATVRVDLIEEDNVCSSASKHGKYRQEVRIGAQTTLSVPFIIIPMKEGEFRIEVKAAVKGSKLTDEIMKKLRVVPEGVLVKDPKIVFLDPTNKGVDGEQVVIINSGIAKKDLVPNTPTSTQISVTGREQVSALLENAVSGNSMGTLIKKPGGCGEQNMIGMTLPLIAATYLDKTNQWEAVGFEKRNEALQHIKTGYDTELTYRKNDGSFAIYPKYPSSSWLTAYVAKVFAMAHNLVAVQSPHICEAIKFLILNAQQPDGLFREVGNVFMGQMMGGVRGSDSDASMTAFCLIAMQESRTICAASVS
ncbi:hypothetical protein JOQ06_020361, partial [Pogonophryne albipinna]